MICHCDESDFVVEFFSQWIDLSLLDSRIACGYFALFFVHTEGQVSSN